MRRALGPYVVVSASCALVACAAFGGTDATSSVDGGSVADGADPTSADGSMQEADGGSGGGGGEGGGASDASKDSTADGSFFPYGTYCKAPPTGTIFCADFDETGVDAGWTLQSSSGITLGASFNSGSSPYSLNIVTPMGATGVVVSPLIPLAPLANKHLAVQWRFVATPPDGGSVRLAYLGFDPIQAVPVFLTASGLACGGVTTSVATGPHTLLLEIAVGAGEAASYGCVLDGMSIANGATIPSGATGFRIFLGDQSPIAVTTQQIDDVIMYGH